jgi:ComF family protein
VLFRRPLLDLLLPMRCVLCDSARGAVCIQCELKLLIEPRVLKRFDLQGVASATYNPPVAGLISNFKEHGYSTLSAGMAGCMAAALKAKPLDDFDSDTVLVPVADHPNSVRGFSHTRLLTSRLAVRLGISWVAALRMNADAADQASLDVEARKYNLVNAMSALPAMRGLKVVIVDDLVTTGSTVKEAKRALVEQGCEVLGFVAFAETLKKF